MKEKFIKVKVDAVFARELEEMAIKNTVVSGYKPSLRRITKAVRKSSMWQRDMKPYIEKMPLEDDRWRNNNE